MLSIESIVMSSTLELHKYQELGKDFLKFRNIAYLGDVPGLGKTAQYLLAAQELKNEKKVRGKLLIVCPAVLVHNQKHEIKKWGCDLDATVASYSSLHKIQEQFEIIVGDEFHYTKNPNAKRTRQFYRLAGDAKYVWASSGTPFRRCSTDIYPFLKFCGAYPGNYVQFAERFAIKKYVRARGRLITQYSGGKNLRELKNLYKPYLLRRFKKDVLSELPEKQLHEVFLLREPTSKYEKFLDVVAGIVDKQEVSESISKEDRSHIATLRKDLGLSKIKEGVAFCEAIAEDEQLVVFAHHREVIRLLEQEFKNRDRTVGYIWGGQRQDERERILNAWYKGNIERLILSLEAASVGLNLTEASKAVMFELPWNPSTLIQACNRIHRIGQQELTNIYLLIMENSFDEPIKRILKQKERMIDELVGEDT